MEQSDILKFAISVLENISIQYMVVGSLASMAYGEPRLTQDIDIVINPTLAQLQALCLAFPPSEFYLSKEAAFSALNQANGQFNVIHPDSGNKIDFMIARKDAWGREQILRRQKMPLLPDTEGYAARPEDVIIGKMIYYEEGGSEKHLRDIASMLKISGHLIDRNYIATWSDQLRLSEIWAQLERKVPGPTDKT